METVENKYITVAYKLYTMEDGEKELFEEAKAEHPFQFISGLGTTLEDFENQITALSKGDKFDFLYKIIGSKLVLLNNHNIFKSSI